MPSTPNYGWSTPADTDYVTNGALAIRTLGNNADATVKAIDNAKLNTSGGTITGPLDVTGGILSGSTITASGGLIASTTLAVTGASTFTGLATANGGIKVNGATGINFGNNDTITFDDTFNEYHFNADGILDRGNISCDTASVYNLLDVDGRIIASESIETIYVQLDDNYCRPIIDDNAFLGSPSLRWTRVFAVNTTISSSDARDKLDVQDSELGLDFINDLRPVSYRWVIGDKKRVLDKDGNPAKNENGEYIIETREGVRQNYGLIAQEVKQAIDNSGVQDFAGWVQDDLSDPESHQSLSYEQFIAPMVKAIQELSSEVESLKAQLNGGNK
jgi:hypothetical protein